MSEEGTNHTVSLTTDTYSVAEKQRDRERESSRSRSTGVVYPLSSVGVPLAHPLATM